MGGWQSYPNFGMNIRENMFKMFVSAAAFAWAKKEHWFIDKRYMVWDIFSPCLKNFNDKRTRLLQKVFVLILDESMLAWRPKTSKPEGLPNYTFEARKHIPLGTMFQNGCEVITGMLVYQDAV